MKKQNTYIIPIICWAEMDEQTICVRLDNADHNCPYRIIFNGKYKAYRDSDNLFRYHNAVPGTRYEIVCEIESAPDKWETCCLPVKLNFIPPSPEPDVPVVHIGGMKPQKAKKIILNVEGIEV